MATLILNILIFLSVIVILVTVHEFGHFIVAKGFGIKVHRFSIGFGKPLWSIKDKTGTEYVVAPIPLGGYVRLLDSRDGEPVADQDLPYAFDKRPVLQRIAVLAAGPVFNLLFAILAFWMVFVLGVTSVMPVVGSVVSSSPAALAGISPNDRIVKINNYETPQWADVSIALMLHYGNPDPLTITVKKFKPENAPNRSLQVPVAHWHLNSLQPDPLQSLGIIPFMPSVKMKWPAEMVQVRQYPVWKAFLPAFHETTLFTLFNGAMIYKMLTGVISLKGLGGPISIAQIAVLAAKQGLVIYLNFLALLSICLGVLNLLPIPGLDGAQLLYCFLEIGMRRPVSDRTQILAYRLGLVILFLLIVQALLNDLFRL